MYLGSAFTTLGKEEKTIEYVRTSMSGGAVSIIIKAAEGYGDAYFGVYVNTNLIESIYVNEGEESDSILIGSIGSNYSVVILHHGNSDSINLEDIVTLYFEPEAQTVNVNWSWDYDIMGGIDNDGDDIDFLSNWSLSGLSYSDLYRDSIDTRGYLMLSVAIDGSDVTVSLSNNTGVISSGTGTDSSTITLTGDLTGSVDVATAEELSGKLYVRYPKELYIYRSETSPPDTRVGLVSFNNQDSTNWAESDVLDAGTYYYAYRVLSDTNDLSSLSTPEMVVMTGLPKAPANLSYQSGNASNTVLFFSGSETVGASYNLYLRQEGCFDFDSPGATAAAGAMTINMPAITGYPCKVMAVLRAEFSGVEEKNYNVLNLEYDASGNIVYPRPNTPTITSITVSNGLTVNVSGKYDSTGEEASPTKLQLFTRDPDNAYDFNDPDAEGALSANNTASMEYELTNGWYYITIKSANENIQSEDYAQEQLIFVDAEDASVSNITFNIERS